MPRKSTKQTFSTQFVDTEGMSLEQLADEYLSLQEKLAPLTQRVSDLKDRMKEVASKGTVAFPSGIEVKLTTFPIEHFDVKAFKEDDPNTYNAYMDCRTQTRLTVKRVKLAKM